MNFPSSASTDNEKFIKSHEIIHPESKSIENNKKLHLAIQQNDISKVERYIKEGYDVNWWVLDSKHYGVPQTRRRVYIYGSLKKLKKKYPIEVPTISKKNITTKTILDKKVDNYELFFNDFYILD